MAQAIKNQLPVTFTGSLKVMSIFASSATLVVLLAGVVLATVGAVSPPLMHTVLLFCGSLGVSSWKSELLLSVSVLLRGCAARLAFVAAVEIS